MMDETDTETDNETEKETLETETENEAGTPEAGFGIGTKSIFEIWIFV